MSSKVLEIDYRPFVQNIQRSMVSKGLMQPIPLARFIREIDREIEVHREVYLEELRQNWELEFPNVAFSESLLRTEVDRQLVIVKNRTISCFRKALTAQTAKERRYKIVFGWMFRSWDVWLIASFIMSLSVTFPLLLHLFFSQSDLGFHLGGLGLLVNLAVVAVIAYKAEKTRRSNSCSQN